MNKNNTAKKTNVPKEPATKWQHSYTINNSPQNKSSTYDLNKLCAFHNFMRKHKMAKIQELLERPIAPQIRKRDSTRTLNRNLSGGQRHYQLAATKEWNCSACDKNKKRIDFIYGGSKCCNSVNSIKVYQRRVENNI